jgi:hypothetical protein
MWDKLAPMIERACIKGRQGLTVEEVKRMLDADLARVLLFDEGCAVLEPGACLFIVTMTWSGLCKAGQDELQKVLVSLARHIGANEIMAVGRKGWARAMKHYGYRATGNGYVVCQIGG